MEPQNISNSSASELGSAANEEIWCLKRVGMNSGWLRLFDDTEVTLGRGLDVTYHILSSTCPLMISRNHCLFRQNEEGKWTVTDTKSLNGVWVNGDRIHPDKAQQLSVGDSVKLGVPLDGTHVEFEYILARDHLDAVKPYLVDCSKEDDNTACRNKKTKRKFGMEDTSIVPESKPKLYRYLNTDKSLGGSCPLEDGQPERPKAQDMAGPSVAVTGPGRPAAVSELGAPQVLKDKSSCLEQLVEGMRAELEVKTPEMFFSEKEKPLEVKKRQQEEEMVLKRKLEETLRENTRVIEELKSSRQGFEEILQAKDRELEETKEEKEKARAQKEEVVIQMTEVLENELQCIICSELFIEAVTLNCAHSFCLHCIEAWRKRKDECPICRQSISAQTRSLVLDNCIDRMVENLSSEMKERRQGLVRERKGEGCTRSAQADKGV